MTDIDLTPTPEGFKRIANAFEQQIASSRQLITDAEALQASHDRGIVRWSIIEKALDALIDQEERRIEAMQLGLRCAQAGEMTDLAAELTIESDSTEGAI